jgi:hypothetical protein
VVVAESRRAAAAARAAECRPREMATARAAGRAAAKVARGEAVEGAACSPSRSNELQY